jgi:hypothetical protein
VIALALRAPLTPPRGCRERIEMDFDLAQHNVFAEGHFVWTDQFRRMQMTKNSAERQTNAIGAHPVSPENERQTAERRRFEDALEDDEVYEALMSLHAERQANKIDGAGDL